MCLALSAATTPHPRHSEFLKPHHFLNKQGLPAPRALYQLFLLNKMAQPSLSDPSRSVLLKNVMLQPTFNPFGKLLLYQWGRRAQRLSKKMWESKNRAQQKQQSGDVHDPWSQVAWVWILPLQSGHKLYDLRWATLLPHESVSSTVK